jgi:hypothetical protein
MDFYNQKLEPIMKIKKRISFLPLFSPLLLLAFHAQAQSTLAQDLQDAKPPGITAAQTTQLRQQLTAIENSQNSKPTPAIVGAPDYPVARANLQRLISKNFALYLQQLTAIQTDLEKTFSELAGLSTQNDGTPLMNELYAQEVERLLPLTNTAINQKYTVALQDLYLVGEYNIAVRKNRRIDHGDFEGYQNLGCITGACALKITEDLNAWYTFALPFNQSISILEAKMQTIPSDESLDPFVTQALLHTLDHLTAGPQANIDYNLGNYLVALLQVPAGQVAKISVIPTFIFEKLIRVAGKLLDTHFERVDLALKKLNLYSDEEILESITRQQKTYSQGIAAVLYGNQISQYPAPSGPNSGTVSSLPAGKYRIPNGTIYLSDGATFCYYLDFIDYQRAGGTGSDFKEIPALPADAAVTGDCVPTAN